MGGTENGQKVPFGVSELRPRDTFVEKELSLFAERAHFDLQGVATIIPHFSQVENFFALAF